MAIGVVGSACGDDPRQETLTETTPTTSKTVTASTTTSALAELSANSLAAWQDATPFIRPATEDDLWLSPGAGVEDSQETGFLVNLGGCLGLLPYPDGHPIPLLIGGNGAVQPNVVELLDDGNVIGLGDKEIALGTFVALGGTGFNYPEQALDQPPPDGCPVADDGGYFAVSPFKAEILDEYDPEFHGPYD